MRFIIPKVFYRVGSEGSDEHKYARGAFYGTEVAHGDSYFHQEKLGKDNFVIHAKSDLTNCYSTGKFLKAAEIALIRRTLTPILPTNFTYSGNVYYGVDSRPITTLYQGWKYIRHGHFNGCSIYIRTQLDDMGDWPGPLSPPDPEQGDILSFGKIPFTIKMWFTMPNKLNPSRLNYFGFEAVGFFSRDMFSWYPAGLVTRYTSSHEGFSALPVGPDRLKEFSKRVSYMPWTKLSGDYMPHKASQFQHDCELIGETLYATALSIASEFLPNLQGLSHSTSRSSGVSRYMKRLTPPMELEDSFLFYEKEILWEKVPPETVARGAAWHINNASQHAFVDALENAPRLNQNSLQNLFELVSFVKGVVVDKKINIPSSLSNAWLAYRYSYSTTKMDVEEAIRFMKRNSNWRSLIKGFTCRGTYHFNVDGIDAVCRARVTLRSEELVHLEAVTSALFEYGLSPNFYVIWDAVPYSFIIDWFIPIGDMLGIVDLEQEYLRGKYKISDVVYSLKYRTGSENTGITRYTRWVSPPPSHINKFYWLVDNKTSTKTTIFRFLDATTLIIGG